MRTRFTAACPDRLVGGHHCRCWPRKTTQDPSYQPHLAVARPGYPGSGLGLSGAMDKKDVPVEEIAKAVSGAVTSVLSKISAPRTPDSSDEFDHPTHPPFLKRPKIAGNVICALVRRLYLRARSRRRGIYSTAPKQFCPLFCVHSESVAYHGSYIALFCASFLLKLMSLYMRMRGNLRAGRVP